MRKKGEVWNHFTIVSKDYNSHPHVRCNHCSKDFQRGVPERMQAHVNTKCSKAPNNAKQQNTISITDNNSFHMSEKEQSSLESLVTKKLSSSEVLLPFVNNPMK
ncbi:unnamed protein product [Rhizophagus irregularis]|nr:unnamed protein product [Rhizophagus irregularis]CAB5367125.1 unnamed protein product [Rhizophagus irregularis]